MHWVDLVYYCSCLVGHKSHKEALQSANILMQARVKSCLRNRDVIIGHIYLSGLAAFSEEGGYQSIQLWPSQWVSSWKEFQKYCCIIDKQKKMCQRKTTTTTKNNEKLFYLSLNFKKFRSDFVCSTHLFNFWSVFLLAFLVCSTLQIVKQRDTWHNSYRQCSHFRLLFRFKLRIKNAKLYLWITANIPLLTCKYGSKWFWAPVSV